jgi:hypothetical protein
MYPIRTRLASGQAQPNFRQRKRTGGNQHVTVKHIHQQVNVTEGGQAVVAGDTVTRGQGERRPGMIEK